MMQILERVPDRFEVCYEAMRGYGHYQDLPYPVPRVSSSDILCTCE